jgi:hypothetical protein
MDETEAIRSGFARRSVATSNDVRQSRLLQLLGAAIHCLDYSAASHFDSAIFAAGAGA